MDESSKTKRFYGSSFFEQFCIGHGIDVGCGRDIICKSAEPFDKIHGDANNILKYKQEKSYDFVYSSHTLEHMIDPKKCIRDWFKLLKSGGYLIIIVPDSELYEQGVFPSAFNPDHRWQFTMKCNLTGKNLISIDKLLKEINNYKLIAKKLQDYNYDYSLKSIGGKKIGIFTGKVLSKFIYGLKKYNTNLNPKFLKFISKFLHKTLTTRIDQTLLFDAIAQIQLIIQKP